MTEPYREISKTISNIYFTTQLIIEERLILNVTKQPQPTDKIESSQGFYFIFILLTCIIFSHTYAHRSIHPYLFIHQTVNFVMLYGKPLLSVRGLHQHSTYRPQFKIEFGSCRKRVTLVSLHAIKSVYS